MNSSIKIENGFDWPEITIGSPALQEEAVLDDSLEEALDDAIESFADTSVANEETTNPQPLTVLDETTEENVTENDEELDQALDESIASTFLQEQEIARNSVIETQAIENIKQSILEHYDQILKIPFHGLDYLGTDIFGNLHIHPHPDIFRQDTLSAREKTLLYRILDELIIHCNYSNCNQDTLEMVTPYLLQENRIDELKNLVEKNRDRLDNDFFRFLDLCEIQINKNIDTEAQTTDLLQICYLYKHDQISEEQENILYDSVVSREAVNIIGIPYVIFKQRKDADRPMAALYPIVKKRFEGLTIQEKERFVNDYKHEKEYLSLFFYLRRIYEPEVLWQWLEKEKIRSGKVIPDEMQSRLPLVEKLDFYAEQDKIYYLLPFEILLLLNSEKKEFTREKIEQAFDSFPNTYIVNRAYAALQFFQRDFHAFLRHAGKCGRLQYSYEFQYLKSIACLETGQTEQGEKIITALSNEFPDSEILESVFEKYKI